MADREKYDKPKTNSSVKHIPKDAQVIMSILKELNVTEYEPRVINQLLEFTYSKYRHSGFHFSIRINELILHFVYLGYVTCILDDAKIYANHAKKKVIELDDVKLACQMTLEKAFTAPPPREVGRRSNFKHIFSSEFEREFIHLFFFYRFYWNWPEIGTQHHYQ